MACSISNATRPLSLRHFTELVGLTAKSSLIDLSVLRSTEWHSQVLKLIEQFIVLSHTLKREKTFTSTMARGASLVM